MLSRSSFAGKVLRRAAALQCCGAASRTLSSSSMFGMKNIIGSRVNNNGFLSQKAINFSTQLFVRNQQVPLDESALSQHIFQFIQGQTEGLPLQNFADLDKLLQTLIFQGHLIYRAQTLEEWKPVYYEILSILSSNSSIFADIEQTQLAEVEKDVKEFSDAITNTFEKYSTSGGLENKVVGDILRMLSEDVIVSSLPTVKFAAGGVHAQFVQRIADQMGEYAEKSNLPQIKVILLSRKALSLHKLGALDKALETCCQAIDIMPTFSPGYLVRASTYLFMDKPQESIEDCNRAIAIEEGNLEAYLCRAVSHLKLGDNDKALADLNTVLESHPSRFDALTKRAAIFFSKKMYDSAIIDIERALYYNSNDVQVFTDVVMSFDCAADKCAEQIIVGLFNKSRNQIADAVKAFDEAIKIAPNEPVPYHQRGLLVYNYMGDSQGSLNDLQEAIKNRNNLTSETYTGILLQDYAMIILNLFVSDYKDKASDGSVPSFASAPALATAYSCFAEATTKMPAQAQLKAITSMGSIHIIMNENEQGIEMFTKAIEIAKPKSSSGYTQELRGEMAAAYFNRAHVYHMKIVNNELALKDYDMAIKLNPNNPLFYHYRSMLHIHMGSDELAKKDEDTAKKITERQQERIKQMQKLQQESNPEQPSL